MRHWGFSDAQLSRGGSDAGVDVLSSRAIAQVKFEASQVGRPVVQRLYGARGVDHDKAMLFFTGAGYSPPAIECANVLGVALFKYEITGTMAPVNSAARMICQVAGDVAATTTSDPLPMRSSEELVDSKRWPTFSWAFISLALTMTFFELLGSSEEHEGPQGGATWVTGLIAALAWTLVVSCLIHNGERKRSRR